MRLPGLTAALTGLLLLADLCRAGSPELAVGKASENLDAARLAWQRPWSRQWLVGESGALSGYHSLSINHWWNEHESITALGYSPVFRYTQHDSAWYLRFGIGAAYLSDTQIAGRILGSHFQFEDQFGVGWQQGRHDLALVYMHYSNAGIAKPNHGIDLLLLSYHLRLD